MNNYQRLEINLLPPEMAPSPAVRGSVVFIWAIVALTAVLIGTHASVKLAEVNKLKADNKKLEQDILQNKPFEDEYIALNEIRENTEGRGKLVGMTTATYIEYPIVMDRVARILPDGVYLIKAGSAGSGGSQELDLEFRTATADPSYVPRTLEAFKTSSMFSEAYLRTSDFQPQPLDELKNIFGVNYSFQGPGSEDSQAVDGYDFEIRAFIQRPMEVDDLPTVLDNSDYMTQFSLETDPNAAKPVGGTPGAGAAAPAGSATPPPANGAPGAAPGGAAPAAGGGK
jgi:hypothetical protein